MLFDRRGHLCTGVEKIVMQTSFLQQLSDEDLAIRAMRGNLQAYTVLMVRYRGAVLLIAEEVLGSRASAEDVAQGVFLVVFQSLPRLREPQRFASWLYAITRFRARRAFHQIKRYTPLDIDSLRDLTDSEESQPEKSLLKAERSSEIWGAVERLKSEWRTVFLLRYQEEWSILQIAGFLALSTTTVNWRLHQARKCLLQQLKNDERSLGNERYESKRGESYLASTCEDGGIGGTGESNGEF